MTHPVPYDIPFTRNVINRLTTEGVGIIKFTAYQPPDMTKRWLSLPSKAVFDDVLSELGLSFTHDSAQYGEYFGAHYVAYKYRIITDD